MTLPEPKNKNASIRWALTVSLLAQGVLAWLLVRIPEYPQFDSRLEAPVLSCASRRLHTVKATDKNVRQGSDVRDRWP